MELRRSCTAGWALLLLLPLVAASSDAGMQFPPVGDLLIGRVNSLHASSTCGEGGQQFYCPPGSSCKICDSSRDWDPIVHPNSHRISNVVAKIRNSNATYGSWWMSEPGVENVTIELELKQKFTFTYLIMIFRSYRPRAWWLERSSDYGMTYLPYGYFADECASVFPDVPIRERRDINDVTCTSKYTGMTPIDRGQVVFSSIPQHIMDSKQLYNSSSPADRLRRTEQTDITNLRIHFVKLHTMSNEKLDSSSDRSNYFYGLYEMNVHGMCSCNGHASKCMPRADLAAEELDNNAVYGKCQCTHHTTGENCDECLDFYQDQMWAAASISDNNECKRCNCNGHSDSCEFMLARWVETNQRSGGVCKNCRHNTTGPNCETCVYGFYKDPSRTLSDPEVCVQCLCSDAGSLSPACVKESNKVERVIAGQCPCKTHVTGMRCDECKAGYWNLQANNTEGCMPCNCTILGTVDNSGCHKHTGKCGCKENVMGETCDTCKPGFFNLSAVSAGCTPCDCNFGSSLSGACDINTGQCDCKQGFTGRRCNVVLPGYFVPGSVDFGLRSFPFESATSATSPIRLQPSEEPSVTGEAPMPHDCSSRHDFRFGSEMFKDLESGTYSLGVKSYIVSAAGNSTLRIRVQFKDGRTAEKILVHPSSADAPPAGARMRVVTFSGRVTFDSPVESVTVQFACSTDRAIALDELLLGNNLDNPLSPLISDGHDRSLSVKRRPNVTDWQIRILKCARFARAADQTPQMPPDCLFIVQSIRARSMPRAEICECHSIGAFNSSCMPITGQCYCKTNVQGIKCDTCAANHFALSSRGCQACGCSSNGSASQQCHNVTGVCQCLSDRIDGAKCDRCKFGFWRFPACLKCICNNLAVVCDASTGICLNCRGNSAGTQCEKCRAGFFGDPTKSIQCRRCNCPGSGVEHASVCSLIRTNPPAAQCFCDDGYAGNNCERCAVNFYGNALSGRCTRCQCNGNINTSVSESCHPTTGRCQKCLHNTAGHSCEQCRDGFYGNAVEQNCVPCVCNQHGTHRDSALSTPISEQNTLITYKCDRKTGNCACLPNVEGQTCDRCAALHYNISSGRGCSSCDCDPIGSTDLQCNRVTGQCPCKEGRGGRRCNECEVGYFGDPTKQGDQGCRPCDCNRLGSISATCDSITGQCSCRTAVKGRQCDACERGTTGQLPNCTKCDGCWYSWDRTLLAIDNSTSGLASVATEVARRGGLAGDLADVIRQADDALTAVWRVINETNVSDNQTQAVETMLKALAARLSDRQSSQRYNTTHLSQRLQSVRDTDVAEQRRVKGEIDDRVARLLNESSRLLAAATRPNVTSPTLRHQAIQRLVEEFRENLERLKQQNLAIEKVHDSRRRGSEQRKEVERMAEELKKKVEGVADTARDRVQAVRKRLPGMNHQLCVGYSSSSSLCSPICGGPSTSCNASGIACGAASKCAESAVAQLAAVTGGIGEVEEKARLQRRLADTESQQLNASSSRCSLLSSRAESVSESAKQLQQQQSKLLSRAKQLETDMQKLVDSERIGVSAIRDLMTQINNTNMPVSASSLSARAANLSDLLSRLNASRDVSRVAMETRETRARVSQLLTESQAVANESAGLRLRAQSLLLAIQQTDNGSRSGAEQMQRLEAELRQIAEQNKQASASLKSREDSVSSAAEVRAIAAGRLENATMQDLRIDESVKRVASEQNQTQTILREAMQSLSAGGDDAALRGVQLKAEAAQRRRQQLQQLTQRVNDIRGRLGGGRGNLAALDNKLENLKKTMEASLNRLADLILTLEANKFTVGSSAYLVDKISKQHCNTKE